MSTSHGLKDDTWMYPREKDAREKDPREKDARKKDARRSGQEMFGHPFSGLAYVKRIWRFDNRPEQVFTRLDFLHGCTAYPGLRSIACKVDDVADALIWQFQRYLDDERRLLIACTLHPQVQPETDVRNSGESTKMRLVEVNWFKVDDCKGRPVASAMR